MKAQQNNAGLNVKIYTSGKVLSYHKSNKTNGKKNTAREDTINWRTKTRGHKQDLEILNM